MYSFPNFEPVFCSMSSSNCCFLTYIQISQEVGKVWHSHLLKNFLQFVVIYTVKAFGVTNKAESESAIARVWLFVPHGLFVHGILQARILDWVVFPFYSGSSQPRDQTQVSCMAGGLFTSWAKREAQIAVELAHKTTGMLMGRVRLIHWFFLSLYKHHISELLQTSDEGPRSRDPVHYSAHAVFLP